MADSLSIFLVFKNIKWDMLGFLIEICISLVAHNLVLEQIKD